MPRPCPIALTGLTPTEQVLLEGALFQSAGNQLPGAVLTRDLSKALLIIANADNADAVRALRTALPAARVLLVGASDQGTGWPVVPRPLRLHAVLEAARRALSPVLERPEPEPEPETKGDGAPLRGGGWLRRLTGGSEGPGFMATQPFMAKDLSPPPDFEETRQHAPPAAPQLHEATQPMRAIPAAPPSEAARKGFESTVAFSARAPAQPDFESTIQTDREAPSVLPSDWENEVAEWEAELAARVNRAAARNAPDAPEASVASADTLPQPLATDDRRPLPAGAAAADDGIARVAVGERPSTRDRDRLAPLPAASDDPPCRVLVVGAPGQATGGLIKTLQSARFQADFAASAANAMDALRARPYQVVFLIEISLGEGAIALCRAIRARPGPTQPGPRIAIVAGHRRLLSRIRASFAGCNAWMTIPLDREALVRYIGQTTVRTVR
ncbi:MAG: hypothetical protein IAE92_07255 [Burkholderiaceae bacterium]|nr:hypothetical protein [Burkholderiaceae bacterium]